MLEGPYVELMELGFPISASFELQRKGLRLDTAKWSSRFSDAGLSVSFFWPTAPLSGEATQSRRRCRRRRRPRTRSGHSGPATSARALERAQTPPQQQEEVFGEKQHRGQLSPIDAHPVCSLETMTCEIETTDPVDCETSQESSGKEYIHPPAGIKTSDSDGATLDHLEAAEDLEFEGRSIVPGVKYTTEGRPGWTPIRVKKQKSATKAADVSDNSTGCGISG